MKNTIDKNTLKYIKVKNKWKILITEKLGRQLIRKVHEKYSPIGSKHVVNILSPYYYFKRMRKFICEICSGCKICIHNKTRVRSEKGFLGHLGPAKEPFEIMSFDTIGGLGGKRSTKKYLHLLADHFTTFAYILTSSGQSAKDFIKILDRVNKENQMKLLLTDQYGGLCSKEFEDYLKENNTEHVVTAVDSPESNGLNERLNQTLVNRIRCRMNEKPGNKKAWTTIAQQCVDEYNDTIHSVTGFAPSFTPSYP